MIKWGKDFLDLLWLENSREVTEFEISASVSLKEIRMCSKHIYIVLNRSR